MSINLKIESLSSAAQTLTGLAEDINSVGTQSISNVSLANTAWNALSYQKLNGGICNSFNPMCSASSVLMTQIASDLLIAKEKANEARYASMCLGTYIRYMDHWPSSSIENLYYDEDLASTISDDVGNVRLAIENMMTKCDSIDAKLGAVKTRYLSRISSSMGYEAEAAKEALSTFEGKQAEFIEKLDEFQKICSGMREYVEPFINPGSINAVCTDFSLPNPAALNWYLAVPFSKQTDEAKELIRGLKDKGYSFTRVGVINVENQEIETALTAAGVLVSAHEMSTSFILDLLRILNIKEDTIIGLEKATEVLKAAGFAISLCSAWNAKEKYMALHTELPYNTRESNAATEFDIRLIGDTISLLPPIGDAYNEFVYEQPLEDDELNLTRAEWIYRWRYETMGQYGW